MQGPRKRQSRPRGAAAALAGAPRGHLRRGRRRRRHQLPQRGRFWRGRRRGSFESRRPIGEAPHRGRAGAGRAGVGLGPAGTRGHTHTVTHAALGGYMLCPGTPGDHGGARALGTRRRPASLLTGRPLAAWPAASVGQGGGGGIAGRASDHFNGGSAGSGARARGTARRAGSARPAWEGGGAAAEARWGGGWWRGGSARPVREEGGAAAARREGGSGARGPLGKGAGPLGKGAGLGGARGCSLPDGRSGGPAAADAGCQSPAPVTRGFLEPTPPSWVREEPPLSPPADVRGHSRADVARRTFGNRHWPGTARPSHRPTRMPWPLRRPGPARGHPGCPAGSPLRRWERGPGRREWFSREGLTGGAALQCFGACLQTLVGSDGSPFPKCVSG
ncbi:spidroin-1-like [Cervus canadensis]|uniref:spidroin-1-like n=1 Tax=Cervus canadensis TaxID=1574408 RepID=UPI001C9E1F4D|nr:spidroin-1-like [Cervus canadensis]XP_043320448.1 spidroin-1-like [Cervus canadensis]XP_043320449.1 spidroin-1-like [Cervus canadensis]XP_043320450.1 spidroin-1-like [Cervus canadensis]XP_043320451.1 spidroin-1-like [Cervus canadensis]